MEVNPVFNYKEWMENMKSASVKTYDPNTKYGPLSVPLSPPDYSNLEELFEQAEAKDTIAPKYGFDLEEDPAGTGAHDPGAKLDAGKVMASILLDFNKALLAVAEVGTVGAKKYSRGGWKEVPDGYNRYTDAMIRHLFADSIYDDGINGTGLLHDAQVAWNALARLQYRLEGKLN